MKLGIDKECVARYNTIRVFFVGAKKLASKSNCALPAWHMAMWQVEERSMTVNLEPVFQNIGFSIPIRLSLDCTKETLAGRALFCEPLPVTGEIVNRSGVVYLQATIGGKLFALCDRCAKALEKPLQIGVTHILVTSVNEEETDEMLLLPSMQADIAEILTEDLFLSLPGKTLCKVDCKGLCPQCGKDWNNSPCGCAKHVDPRLAVLQQLLDKTDGE